MYKVKKIMEKLQINNQKNKMKKYNIGKIILIKFKKIIVKKFKNYIV